MEVIASLKWVSRKYNYFLLNFEHRCIPRPSEKKEEYSGSGGTGTEVAGFIFSEVLKKFRIYISRE